MRYYQELNDFLPHGEGKVTERLLMCTFSSLCVCCSMEIRLQKKILIKNIGIQRNRKLLMSCTLWALSRRVGHFGRLLKIHLWTILLSDKLSYPRVLYSKQCRNKDMQVELFGQLNTCIIKSYECLDCW